MVCGDADGGGEVSDTNNTDIGEGCKGSGYNGDGNTFLNFTLYPINML